MYPKPREAVACMLRHKEVLRLKCRKYHIDFPSGGPECLLLLLLFAPCPPLTKEALAVRDQCVCPEHDGVVMFLYLVERM